jgi:hypothetical protein
MKDGQPLSSPSYTLNDFSCIRVYKRPDDGSQFEPKHVAVNTLL